MKGGENMQFEDAKERMRKLAEAREKLAEIHSRRKEKQEELLSDLEYQELIQAEEEQERIVEQCDSCVRDDALREFESTKNKHPFPWANIRVQTNLIYDDSEALEYCKEHLGAAISLNRKVFESVARSIDLPLVNKKTEPKVYIDKDLSEHL